MRVTWVQPEDLVRHELAQSAAEGKDVSAALRAWTEAGGDATAPVGGASTPPAPQRLRELACRLLDELDEIPATVAAEPDELDAIRALCPPATALPPPPGTEPLADRVLGAWLGRAAGCLLGKPVEKIPRRGIREILTVQDRWPLAGYFSGAGLPPEVAERWPWNRASRPTSLAEVIDGMPEDDDLNYTMFALEVLETRGRDFTSEDVASLWLTELPAGRTFTAERAAYRNLLEGLAPPATATRWNPYREWIGAQIRADLYGWVCPGEPWAAAEMAWRDARVSHTRNGIYGAMFAAAMAAAAMVESTPAAVIEAGLGVVPPRSRLAGAVRLAVEAARSEADVERGLDRLEEAFGDLHWVHSVNNAALVAFGLTAGAGDFPRTVCTTVMGGWDTDSNGATAGGVVGALTGAGRLPEAWTAPLKNRVSSSLRGFDGASFDDLARRTLALASAR